GSAYLSDFSCAVVDVGDPLAVRGEAWARRTLSSGQSGGLERIQMTNKESGPERRSAGDIRDRTTIGRNSQGAHGTDDGKSGVRREVDGDPSGSGERGVGGGAPSA